MRRREKAAMSVAALAVAAAFTIAGMPLPDQRPATDIGGAVLVVTATGSTPVLDCPWPSHDSAVDPAG